MRCAVSGIRRGSGLAVLVERHRAGAVVTNGRSTAATKPPRVMRRLARSIVERSGRCSVAWSWKPNERALPEFGTQPGTFQNTPLMIEDVLYVSTPYNRVVALDASNGRELWRYDPEPYKDGQPPNGTGFVHRGVAAWRDDAGRLRIFMNSRYRLICLDAKTGTLVDTFGVGGMVDLTAGLSWKINPRHYTNTSPPVVYRNLVILGNGVGDRLVYRNDPPGDVRAFDARTGKLVWTFRPIPRPGEFGNETWGEGSWAFTGHTNVWAPMSLDEARGLALSASQHAQQRLLRRAAAGRQSLCRIDRLP